MNGALSLFVTVYADPDSALGQFQFDVQPDNQNLAGITFDGERLVKGLGQQATAVFQTSIGGPVVDLYVLSGNAEVEVDFGPTPFNGPEPSRAAMLAAVIVMAREALAGLPH